MGRARWCRAGWPPSCCYSGSWSCPLVTCHQHAHCIHATHAPHHFYILGLTTHFFDSLFYLITWLLFQNDKDCVKRSWLIILVKWCSWPPVPVCLPTLGCIQYWGVTHRNKSFLQTTDDFFTWVSAASSINWPFEDVRIAVNLIIAEYCIWIFLQSKLFLSVLP